MTASPPNKPSPKAPEKDTFLAGIQFWLFFLLTFFVLGYPLPLAIVLGAVGGIAGGTIAGRWQTQPKGNDADHLAQGLDVDLYKTVHQRREKHYTEGRKRRQSITVQDWFKIQRRRS
ncbi:MAG: hypothetical protein ACOYME_13520 [Prochlorotrichaceae cyanobacterium]|jgi:hypothetical protein